MFAVALLLAADLITVDASARAEGRMGTSPNDPTRQVSASQIDAYAGILVKHDDVTFAASYNPRMVETPPPQGSGLAVYHGGRVAVEYEVSKTSHLLVQELGFIGRNDFSPLIADGGLRPVAPLVRDPRLPVKALLFLADSSSTVAWRETLSRQLTLNLSAGYQLYGGVDSIAQRYIPLQRGPNGSTSLSWQVAPSDRLSLSAAGSRQVFTSGAITTLGSMGAGWAHVFDKDTRAELTAGSAFGSTSGPTAVGAPTPFPSLSASLARGFPMRGSSVLTTLRASASPQVDRTNGSIYELAAASAAVDWSVNRNLTFTGRGSFGRALTGLQQVGNQLVTSEGAAQYRIDQLLSFAVGERNVWQSVPAAAPGVLTAPGFQWAIFGYFTVALHGAL